MNQNLTPEEQEFFRKNALPKELLIFDEELKNLQLSEIEEKWFRKEPKDSREE